MDDGPGVGLVGGLVALGAAGLLFLNLLVWHGQGAPSDRVERQVVRAERAAAGREVFGRMGCASCHALGSPRGGTPPTVGPSLQGIARRAGTTRPGMAAEDYLFESIERPQAWVVSGYLNLMPALRERMTAQDCADLVAYLLTLR